MQAFHPQNEAIVYFITPKLSLDESYKMFEGKKCYNITIMKESFLNYSKPILSICMKCRDGRELEHNDVRGGARLAEKIMMQVQTRFDISFDLRGIACMSQCKRPCIVAICSTGRFSYMFGDLDPEN